MHIATSREPLATQKVDAVIVAATENFANELVEVDKLLGGHLVPLLEKRKFKGGVGSSQRVPTYGKLAASELIIVGAGERSDADLARAARHAGRTARSAGFASVALALGKVDQPQLTLENFVAGNYAYDKYKPEDGTTKPLENLVFIGGAPEEVIASAGIRARWQSFARDLVNAPAADLYPETLANKAKELECIEGVTVELWDFERCKAEGCVGIVAVGQGSDRPGYQIHVRYRHPDAKGHIALVGKGVTFDAGGLSIKPSPFMQTMRCDMGGSATVLAAIGAAAEAQLPLNIDCIIGAVENMLGGNAFKLGDILRYNNGVTVEIHNTDAEGRLVLADCLIKASNVEGVTDIIDAATLTGAAAIAVGPDYAALFTKDDALAGELLQAADAEAEYLWRLPLHQPYIQQLKGKWGSIKNLGGREGGATTAALFLQHFVDGPRWAHLDIAGSAFHEADHADYAAGATGEMVRTLVHFLESRAKGA
ncbi:MAG: leucyl aminopeptidase [Deltaproteobacteria bacterium]|nr:MAG: leucyl aminopeptidase [Deltaproteobacteria bacterium]